MNCLDLELKLTSYLLGDLKEADSQQVKAHLAECPKCSAMAKELSSTIGVLSDALSAPNGEDEKLTDESRRTMINRWRTPITKVSFWPKYRIKILELAAVVMILMFFSAMLLPSFSKARCSARSIYKMGEVVGGYEVSIVEPEAIEKMEDIKPIEEITQDDVSYEARVAKDFAPKPEEAPSAAASDTPVTVVDESPAPADFDSVAIVKSPVVLKGIYGERSPGTRGSALRENSEGGGGGGGGAEAKEESKKSDSSDMEPLKIELPKALFVGTPRDIKSANLRKTKYAEATPAPAAPAPTMPEPSSEVVASETVKYFRGDVNAKEKQAAVPGGVNAPVVSRELEKKAKQEDRAKALDGWKSSGDKLKSERDLSAVAGAEASRVTADQFSVETTTISGGVMGNANGTTATVGPADRRNRENDERRLEKVAKSKSPVSLGKKLPVEKNESAEVYYDAAAATPPEKPVNEKAVSDKAGDMALASASEKLLAQENNVRDEKRRVEEAQKKEKDRENEDLKGPRFKASGVNPFFQAADKPFSTFSIDVDTASYTLARNYMNKGLLPPAESVRTEEFVNFFDYAYQPPEKGTFGVYIDCAPSKFGHGLHLLKIGVKGKRLGREEQRRAALTFLVDSSGSMDKPDRMGLIKKSIEKLMSKLNDVDKVTIMQFDTSTRIVVDNQPASKRSEILKAVNNIQCANSTNLEDGMKKAYQLAARNFVPGGENRVLIMSDGVANIGDMGSQVILDSVEKYRKQGIYCSVFGFGAGNYDDTMLESIADKGNGAYNFVDSEQEANRLFVEDMAATLNNIASDVKIQVEFNKDIVSRYRQLGYENRQLKKEDFRNDAIDAGEIGSGQSVTALYELGLNAGRKENICVVRVRYKRTDNGKVEEISRSIDMSDVIKSFESADVRFRLAAGVAEFAEILRASPHAAGSTFEDVAKQLTPVALELSLDKRIQELARLVSVANGMSRADLK